MSRIALVGEAWGEWEAAGSHPFLGVSGVCLFEMLTEAGLTERSGLDTADIRDFWFFRNQDVVDPRPMLRVWGRHKEFMPTNVFNLRPEKNDLEALCVPREMGTPGLPPLPIRSGHTNRYLDQRYLPELIRLGEDLRDPDIGLILCLGGVATWALLHNPGITKIRGTVAAATHLVPGRKLIATYHPAAVLRQWELRHVTILDLMKARREAAFPEIRRPHRAIHVAETLDDLYALQAALIDLDRRESISIDIETHEDQITCVGFAFSKSLAYVVPFTDPRTTSGSFWPTFDEESAAWDMVRRICDSPHRKVLQNCLYDTNFLWRKYGIPIRNLAEDTMLLHHALQPESLKSLGFLGSVYTNEAAWKIMRTRGKTTIKKDE